MIPVSICVIMKNEEAHLPKFISSIKKAFGNYPYELLIVDTGSTDNSVTYAKENGATVLFFDWINDFSAARNYGIERAKYDLILALDCDEYITNVDTSLFDAFYHNHKNGIGMITLVNSMAGSDSLYSGELPRLFNRKVFKFIYSVHEQIRPISDESFVFVKFPLTADHVGYNLEGDALKEKAYRNIDLLMNELKEKEDPYVLFQIGQAYYMIHENEKAVEFFSRACEFDLDPKLDYVQFMIVSYGYALLDCKRYDEALAFENIYDEFATTADFVVLMGLIYMRTGNILKSMSEFLKATTMEKHNTIGTNTFIPLYNMGVINESIGNTEEAITLYKQCGNYTPALNRLKEIEE